LELPILLGEPIVESWDFDLVVVHKRLPLLQNYIIQLVHKVVFVLVHYFFALVESLTEQLRQALQCFVGLLGPFFDFFLDVSEVALEVIELQEALVDEVLLGVIEVVEAEGREPKHLSDNN
jgi:hypothetical protein